MHQHLVDHDLEEQRRDQAEQLQEERRQQDLGQAMAVLVDGAHEPGDVEAARQVGQRAALGHQHQAPAPDRFQLLRASVAGAASCGAWTSNLSSPILPSSR